MYRLVMFFILIFLSSSLFADDMQKLYKYIKNNGGEGHLIITKLPRRLGDTDQKVLIITKVPGIDEESPIWLLRLSNSQKKLKNLISKKIPIVIGKIHPLLNADAATITDDHKIAIDVLKKVSNLKNQTIIFIQPNTSVDSLVHEYQHWYDFENNSLRLFNKKLKEFVSKNWLPTNFKKKIYKLVFELRGYQASINFINKNKNLKLPTLDKFGFEISKEYFESEVLDAEYKSQLNIINEIFNNNFNTLISNIKNRLSNKQFKSLLKIIDPFKIIKSKGIKL